jgi:nucleoid-associated protein YgaU
MTAIDGEEISSALRPSVLVDVLYNEGLTYAKAGSLDAAHDRLTAAVALAPDMVDALVVLGKVCAQRGDYARAIEVWETATRRAPGHQAATDGIVRVNAIRADAARRQVIARALRFAGGGALFALAVAIVPTYHAIYGLTHSSSAIGDAALRDTAVSPGVRVGQRATESESIVAFLREFGGARLSAVQARVDQGIVRLVGDVPFASDTTRLRQLATVMRKAQPIDISGVHVRGDTEYVVKAGDTLWGLSVRFYGAGSRWTRIAGANPSAAGSTARLRAGMRIVIPTSGEE